MIFSVVGLFFFFLGPTAGADNVEHGQETKQDSSSSSSRQNFDGCSASDYYSSLLSGNNNPTAWTRQDLANLVTTTHRNVLSVEGVFEALVDLDA